MGELHNNQPPLRKPPKEVFSPGFSYIPWGFFTEPKAEFMSHSAESWLTFGIIVMNQVYFPKIWATNDTFL